MYSIYNFQSHLGVHRRQDDCLALNISVCIFLKTFFLHNHTAIIKIRNLTLVHFYYLIYKPHSNVANYANNVIYIKRFLFSGLGSSPGSHIAFICDVSLVSFSLEQFLILS